MHTTGKTKRAGGEKRGNKYDRALRLIRLSQRDGHGAGYPVWVEKRAHGKVDLKRDFMRDVQCAHCGHDCDMGVRTAPIAFANKAGDVIEKGDFILDGAERERMKLNSDPSLGEQDRLCPDGSYTLPNLQILCSKCNGIKSNHICELDNCAEHGDHY